MKPALAICFALAACGGGGGDEPTTLEEAQAPRYEPMRDLLLPVPAEWGACNCAFAVWARNNLVEVNHDK